MKTGANVDTAKELAESVIGSVKGLVAPILKENQRLSADLATALEQIAALTKRLDELPVPKDGERGPQGESGPQGIPGEIGKQGPQGERGPVGASVYDVAKEAGFEGNQIEWLVSLKGKDGRDGINGDAGENGRDGRDGKPGEKGLDGTIGRDGRDGFGFDDLSVEFNGERDLSLKFIRGEEIKTFHVELPIVLDRGVFREGEAYTKSDGVTFGGSFFIAQKDSPEGKPGLSNDWRLSVKRGRDGKAGNDGKDFRPPQPVKLS